MTLDKSLSFSKPRLPPPWNGDYDSSFTGPWPLLILNELINTPGTILNIVSVLNSFNQHSDSMKQAGEAIQRAEDRNLDGLAPGPCALPRGYMAWTQEASGLGLRRCSVSRTSTRQASVKLEFPSGLHNCPFYSIGAQTFGSIFPRSQASASSQLNESSELWRWLSSICLP